MGIANSSAWMASSSSQRGTAPRASPPPDQLASFYKLVDKQAIAGALCRYARHAELSASAAVQAEALFGEDDSLVVAHLRMSESDSLSNLSVDASGADKGAFLRRSWAVLLLVVPLLLRRVEANTLLHGAVREEEIDHYARALAASVKAKSKPVSSPALLRIIASTMGYNTLMYAMVRSLDLLPLPWPAAQKTKVESFVLQGLDVISRTAGMPINQIAGSQRHSHRDYRERHEPAKLRAGFLRSCPSQMAFKCCE